jgi:hypothetical protein
MWKVKFDVMRWLPLLAPFSSIIRCRPHHFLAMSSASSSSSSSSVRHDAADLLARTTRYCALSNLHDFDGIEAMISPDDASTCVYGSVGRRDIMDGMRGFFAKFTNVWWEYTDFRPYDAASVEFDFRRYWTDTATGVVMVTDAAEVIEYDANGKILKIFYTRTPSEAREYGPTYPATQAQQLSESHSIVEATLKLFPKTLK